MHNSSFLIQNPSFSVQNSSLFGYPVLITQTRERFFVQSRPTSVKNKSQNSRKHSHRTVENTVKIALLLGNGALMIDGQPPSAGLRSGCRCCAVCVSRLRPPGKSLRKVPWKNRVVLSLSQSLTGRAPPSLSQKSSLFNGRMASFSIIRMASFILTHNETHQTAGMGAAAAASCATRGTAPPTPPPYRPPGC